MITSKHVLNHVQNGPDKDIVSAVKKVLPQRSRFSTHLTAFVDHGKITKSAAYVANELNVLLGDSSSNKEPGLWERLFGSVEKPTEMYVANKTDDELIKEYVAKKSGWMPRDTVPANYADTVKRLESWRIALEKASGMALTLVHSLRGSSNKTNAKSNHRPENGGTAADFQPIGVKWSDANALLLLKAAQSISQPVNQLLVEPSDKGGIVVHIDVKVPGKSDKRIATKGGKTIVVKGATTPTASSVTSNTDVGDFIDAVMTQCFKYQSLDGLSRRCVAETLRLESGNVVGEKLKLRVVNKLGYSGPFQFGVSTWNGIAAAAGVSKFSTKAEFKAACLEEKPGGPGDPVANAKALAAYWDQCARHIGSKLGKDFMRKIVSDDFGMYIPHQQGPGGAVHYLTKGTLLHADQSAESIRLMQAARKRLVG